MPIKKVLDSGRVPVKIWTDDISLNAIEQLQNMATLPFIHKHVAAMPDVHLGIGATVGAVIPTINAVIPAAVGVDIGCGMIAARLTLQAKDLPDNLRFLRLAIEDTVPHGRTKNGKKGDVGAWAKIPDDVDRVWEDLALEYHRIIGKHPKAKGHNVVEHLGTLGTGNHFIELCLDEKDDVWIVLHSGSRGPGNRFGTYFIEQAKELMRKFHIYGALADPNLAYFPQETELFDDYIQAVNWAQLYAYKNRLIMLQRIVQTVRKYFQTPKIRPTEAAINCHHNYVTQENHYGKNVFLTRKGAINAGLGKLGIIPGSMGDKSYIVEGLGNKESFCSCSHGAGRRMSRRLARDTFSVSDLEQQTKGIECPVDAARLDEIPAAYKPIDEVMENQTDLVKIRHTLRQVLNVKG